MAFSQLFPTKNPRKKPSPSAAGNVRGEAGKLQAQTLIGAVRASGRSLLTEAESKLLLKAPFFRLRTGWTGLVWPESSGKEFLEREFDSFFIIFQDLSIFLLGIVQY